MSLNRGQLSLLITLFSMSIIVLVLYNISLGQGKGEEDEYIVEMMLAEEDIDELIEEKERLMEEMANAEPIKSHMAYNETAKPSYGNPEPLQTLEELMAEKEANSDSEELTDVLSDGEYAARVKELKKETGGSQTKTW
ncbi:hypothetical protein [Aggregatimonas sangjinii]|uniref:hypothetical protein n=1 Tax=Aggregatimonas sangjinii TaxID=2583587 RepID=UPI0026D1CF06|nr:hypothetical protein [Aggregatimonas sangjinii]